MIINEKFKSEISPLTKDEYDLLEKQIIADGYDTLFVKANGQE